METPRDYLKKPDWLDKASAPNDGPKVAFWLIGMLLLATVAAALLISGLFF